MSLLSLKPGSILLLPLLNATPLGFFLVRHPRIAPANHAHVVGGGTTFLLQDSAVTVKSSPCPTLKTFELSSVTLKLLHSKPTIFNGYRHPPATTKTHKPKPFSLFLSELNTFISLAATTPHEFLITGNSIFSMVQQNEWNSLNFVKWPSLTNVVHSKLRNSTQYGCYSSKSKWFENTKISVCFISTFPLHAESLFNKGDSQIENEDDDAVLGLSSDLEN